MICVAKVLVNFLTMSPRGYVDFKKRYYYYYYHQIPNFTLLEKTLSKKLHYGSNQLSLQYIHHINILVILRQVKSFFLPLCPTWQPDIWTNFVQVEQRFLQEQEQLGQMAWNFQQVKI